jgi:hypothetical protein
MQPAVAQREPITRWHDRVKRVGHLLNIERSHGNREFAVRLLGRLDTVVLELRRLWVNPTPAELDLQIKMLEAKVNALEVKLDNQYPELRSDSELRELYQLKQVLRFRKSQVGR